MEMEIFSRTIANKQPIINLFNIIGQLYYQMIDWEGLLKFSLKYTDGTKKSEFKEMSQEDKKWLEEAMQQYTNSEVNRIKHILAKLEGFQELDEESLTAQLEQLQELLDSLDKGAVLYKLGGHINLLKIIFYGKWANPKILCLQIYSSANQNDAAVQNISINTGALEMIDLLKKEEHMPTKQALLAAISATIRGQNLEAKRIFIRMHGLELLSHLRETASTRLIHKINVLWRDLLYYDNNLHRTYNDLSHFSNTSNIAVKEKPKEEGKYDLTYDINQQHIAKNELPQNAHFRNTVHKFMEADADLFKSYLHWLQQQIAQEGQQ